MKFNYKSYRTSPTFGYIIKDFELLKDIFEDKVKSELKKIEKINQHLDNQRLSLSDDFDDVDIYDLQNEEIKNSNLKQFFINATLLYFYSQLEIKLVEICKRLPILFYNKNKEIEEFVVDQNTSLDTIAEYIESHTQIDINQFKDWLKIKDFNDIRNVIAHNERVRDGKINTIKSIASRNKKHIRFIENSKTLIIRNSYLEVVLIDSYHFLDKILDEIWKTKN